jgi:hypothetical protein
MYPNNDGTTWTVASKDHELENKAIITAYSIVAEMRDGSPISADDYRVVSATSAVTAHPTMQVDLPDDFVVVGGGARTNYAGAGNLLFASYPTPDLQGWIASAKDHDISDPASITVWAIGLKKSFLQRAGMTVKSFYSSSSPDCKSPKHHLCRSELLSYWRWGTCKLERGGKPSHSELPAGSPNGIRSREGSCHCGPFNDNRLCYRIPGELVTVFGLYFI